MFSRYVIRSLKSCIGWSKRRKKLWRNYLRRVTNMNKRTKNLWIRSNKKKIFYSKKWNNLSIKVMPSMIVFKDISTIWWTNSNPNMMKNWHSTKIYIKHKSTIFYWLSEPKTNKFKNFMPTSKLIQHTPKYPNPVNVIR